MITMFEKIKKFFSREKKGKTVEELAQEFEERQAAIDIKYEKEGLTDEVLDEQIKLNQDRHEHNIADPNKRIYENFVQ